MKKSVIANLTKLVLILPFAGLGTIAQAGVGTSLMQTAGVIAPGSFEVKAQADFIIKSKVDPTGGAGFNLSPHLVTGLIEHYLDVDAFFGTGTTDFQIGALAKFNLLPDIPGQLGLSFLGGLSFIKDNIKDVTRTGGLFTTGVLVSKTLSIDSDKLMPYAAYEFETLFRTGGDRYPSTLIAGAKWEPAETQPWTFYGELGISLHQSFFSLSLGASQTF